MITIDARWFRHSGIGTYVRNIVPRLINILPDARFSLIGDSADLEPYRSARVTIIPFITKMYSLRKIPVPKCTSLYFSPHYTIPLSYTGPLVTTVHDVMHLANPEFSPGLDKRVYAKAMFTAVRFKSTRVISVSRFSASELLKHTGINATVIYNGIDQAWFGEHERQNSTPYIIYVGNVKPHKNLRNLVAAFQLIRGRIPHDLVIVGKRDGFITGDNIDESPGVRFTGFVSDKDLMGWVQHAAALVFPSFYEGFGFPPLEAMACGTPVVAANISSIQEICGDAAIYFDPYNLNAIAHSILSALDSPSVKERGVARAKMFTWEKCAEETCSVLREATRS